MRKALFFAVFAGVLSFGLLAPRAVQAESNGCTGNCSASASVSFQVIIPTFLRLQIGSVGAGNVELITFDMTALPDNIGDLNPQAGTGGDAGPGAVTARVIANGGVDVRLNTTLLPALGLDDGAGNFIAWDEIDTLDGGTMPAPALQNGGVAEVVYAPNLGPVVSRSDTWTYRYANNTVPVGGRYTGTATYTASAP